MRANELSERALEVFEAMQAQGIMPDMITDMMREGQAAGARAGGFRGHASAGCVCVCVCV